MTSDSPELAYLKQMDEAHRKLNGALVEQLLELTAQVNALIGFQKSALIDQGLSPEEAGARLDKILDECRASIQRKLQKHSP